MLFLGYSLALAANAYVSLIVSDPVNFFLNLGFYFYSEIVLLY